MRPSDLREPLEGLRELAESPRRAAPSGPWARLPYEVREPSALDALPDAVDDRRSLARRLREAVKAAIPRRFLIQRLPAAARPEVLLSFDDGPDPEITPAILDRLDRFGARSVFFVVGRNLDRDPGLLREIVARGHLVGNHSFEHVNGDRAPIGRYLADTRLCQDALEDAGIEATLFRPPEGSLRPAALLVPAFLGMRCVTWSLDSHDWRFRTSAEARSGAAWVLARIAPRDIVLLHDNRGTTVEMLDHVLPVLRDSGFDLASGASALAPQRPSITD